MERAMENKTEVLIKKQNLKRLKRLRKQIEWCNDAIEDACNNISMTQKVTDMPTGSGVKKDLSDYVIKMQEKIERMFSEKIALESECDVMLESINNLTSIQEREVLLLRYDKGMSWEKIREKMKYEKRYIFEIHRKAIINLRILKEHTKRH